MTDTLGDALPRECARAREVLAQYREIGPAGRFGAMIIEQHLREADAAMISGDVVAMIAAYENLKGVQ